MRLMRTVCAVAIAATAIAATPDAFAQRNRNNATTVVVFDYQRLLAESTAGRGISASLQAIGQQINQEAQALAPEAQSLQQEQQRIEALVRNMTPQQRRDNSQVQAFAQRYNQFQGRRAQLEGDLQCTQAIALRTFDQQISPVVRQVMEAHGAGVVLDSNATQMHAPQFDVTNEVLERVNQTVPSVAVTRRPYTECVPQQAAPAAPPSQ
jgi:Skp family chaperone for outer membrane proteins